MSLNDLKVDDPDEIEFIEHHLADANEIHLYVLHSGSRIVASMYFEDDNLPNPIWALPVQYDPLTSEKHVHHAVTFSGFDGRIAVASCYPNEDDFCLIFDTASDVLKYKLTRPT